MTSRCLAAWGIGLGQIEGRTPLLREGKTKQRGSETPRAPATMQRTQLLSPTGLSQTAVAERPRLAHAYCTYTHSHPTPYGSLSTPPQTRPDAGEGRGCKGITIWLQPRTRAVPRASTIIAIHDCLHPTNIYNPFTSSERLACCLGLGSPLLKSGFA